jgi:hypothetical protein
VSEMSANIPTERQEYASAASFAVEVGTTGPRGGDAGHGGRTVLTLDNLVGTAWEVEIDGRVVAVDPDRVTLRFGGDSEGANLIGALEFAALTLRQRWG